MKQRRPSATAPGQTCSWVTTRRVITEHSADARTWGYLYDHKRLLNETDDIGGDVTKTYASGTTDEFGDLIGEEGEYAHQYDATGEEVDAVTCVGIKEDAVAGEVVGVVAEEGDAAGGAVEDMVDQTGALPGFTGHGGAVTEGGAHVMTAIFKQHFRFVR